MKKMNLLFDLDGTLTDSMEGITNSVAYALKYYGILEVDRQKLCCFIGPPLKESFMKYYDFDEAKAEAAVVKYREYFGDRGLYENRVYEGIPELLENLKAAGRTLYVATSKPTLYARKILEHFGLWHYFADIQGSNMDGTRVKKDEVIKFVLEVNELSDRNSVVMIGDRSHDIIGGAKCEIDTIGVLYGFGSRQELETAGAVHIAADVKELEKVLMAI